jgi:perosamine synthetase
MLKKKNKRLNTDEIKIIKIVFNLFKNKPKGHHDPLFIGNERKYLNHCIKSGYVSYVGNFVKKFENKITKFTKSKYAVATSSGTSALHLSLKYFNVDHNDEVLLPSLTYVATANAVKYCNATPNFVDIENQSMGICPKKLSNYLKKIVKKKGKFSFNKKTGKKIKALIAVHLYGFPCKINEIQKICKKYNLILIEDAAEAFGSFYKKKHLGTFGDAGVLSFNGNKPITCGSGGAVITNNKHFSKKIKHLSTHAKVNDWYDHKHDEIGYNYRMNNLSAAVGCAQIEKIKTILKAKRKNFSWYEKAFKNLSGIKILKEPKYSNTNYWLITGYLKNYKLKNKLLKTFKTKGFGFRTTWRPLHSLKIFKNCPKDSMSVSNDFFKKAISFPSGPKINF